MAYVIAAPEMMEAASTDLATIGSTLNAAHMAAATPTVALVPAAADEVSAGIAALFSAHAQDYQAQAAKAAAAQGQFVANLTGSAGAYASAEDAIHAFLVALAQGNSAVFLTLEQPLVHFAMTSDTPLGGVAFLSIFQLAIPFFINLVILNAISQAITGQPI
jgi:hypothetical protein